MERKVMPITPDKAVNNWSKKIPDEVIKVVNELLSEKCYNGFYSVTILQDEIVDRLVKDGRFIRNELYENHWLDFEPIYREAGWDVKYDKPGFNETYKANFTFKRKTK